MIHTIASSPATTSIAAGYPSDTQYLLFAAKDYGVDLARTSPGSMATPEQTREAAREMESFFLFKLLKEMRKAIGKSELFHQDHAQEQYEDIMDEAMADHLSKSGGFGLADAVYQDLVRFQLKNCNANDDIEVGSRTEISSPMERSKN